MDIEKVEQNQEINIMLIAKHFTNEPSPPLIDVQIPCDELGISPQDDDMIMDVSNLIFDHIKINIVQKGGNISLMI